MIKAIFILPLDMLIRFVAIYSLGNIHEYKKTKSLYLICKYIPLPGHDLPGKGAIKPVPAGRTI